ncbi:MAG: DUF5677 domain-containing protein [bacterium]|nr:DUF5677 domain-containing protein [bacterium]
MGPSLEQLLECADRTIEELAASLTRHTREVTPHLLINLVFLSRTRTSFRAIKLLCKHGLDADAVIVMRSMVENVISLLYINAEPSSRAGLYADHLWVEEHKRMNALRDVYPPETFAHRYPEDQVRLIERNYRRVNAQGWSDLSLEAKAREVDVLHLYALPYRFGSGYAHGSPITARSYAKWTDTGILLRDGRALTESDSVAPLVLKTAVLLVGIAVEELCKVRGVTIPSAYQGLHSGVRSCLATSGPDCSAKGLAGND